VHGAKGLEAPIVILADTTTPPAGPPGRQPRLLPVGEAERPRAFIWAGRKADDVPLIAGARRVANEAAENEHRRLLYRLLYVAMTRAADRLVVCGAVGERGKPPGCWYDLVHDALIPSCIEEGADDGEGQVWRLCGAPLEGAPAEEAGAVQTAFAFTAERPAWLDRDAALPREHTGWLSPSTARQKDPPRQATEGSRAALLRGTLVHRLLQALPAIAPERRAEAARQYLDRAPGGFPQTERESLIAQAAAVLDDPRFSGLFGPGSRAEVPIVGRIAAGSRTIAVSGQVDRLIVAAEGVLIADYKTNRPAPRSITDVPEAYVTQLALYRAVLAAIYPGRPLRAALVWTDVPDLLEIPSDALDRAFASVTAP
jgi:ATP-dependent helicase/nuclease subunit A